MLTIHADSHLDHGLTQEQTDYIVSLFKDREGFFIETVTLPENLGTAPCGLYGPIMGDAPVTEDQVFYAKRGNREYTSRMCNSKPGMPRMITGELVYVTPMRYIRVVSIIAGPHDGQPCVVYTMFGGPVAPREPGDIRAEMNKLEETRRVYFQAFQSGKATDEMKDAEAGAHAKIIALRPKRDESDKFWSEHALAY